MFYQDYQTIAQLKQQEIERKAKDAWKFFEQPVTKHSIMPAKSPKPQPQCCPVS
jgi:hypothetical protein